MTKQARASIPSVFDDGETTPSGKAVKQKPMRGDAADSSAQQTPASNESSEDAGGEERFEK